MTTQSIPTTSCPECNRRIPKDSSDPELLKRFHHTIDCTQNTIASLRAAARFSQDELRTWVGMYHRDSRIANLSRDRLELANRRLREENNALRKKLHPGKC